VWLFLNFDTIK